jgi:glycine cleavage system H protein
MAYTTPSNLLYARSHEWITTDGDELTIGITDYAQQALGDVVFVDLPEVGRTLKQGEPFGAVESVKAASDVYAPVGGEVTAVNEALLDAPELINNEPYAAGWLLKLRPDSFEQERTSLLDAVAYEQHAAEEESGH